MHAQTLLAAQLFRTQALWNQIIPKCAVRVEDTPDGKAVRYLHPTKGWHVVSKKRLGIHE